MGRRIRPRQLLRGSAVSRVARSARRWPWSWNTRKVGPNDLCSFYYWAPSGHTAPPPSLPPSSSHGRLLTHSGPQPESEDLTWAERGRVDKGGVSGSPNVIHPPRLPGAEGAAVEPTGQAAADARLQRRGGECCRSSWGAPSRSCPRTPSLLWLWTLGKASRNEDWDPTATNGRGLIKGSRIWTSSTKQRNKLHPEEPEWTTSTHLNFELSQIN